MKTLVGGIGLLLFTAVVVSVFLVTSGYISNLEARPANQSTVVANCKNHGVHHEVTIRQGKPSTFEVDGHLCDTLTITNEDDRLRLMAFGIHSHHQAYDGVVEKLLAQGKSLTVTFDQLGRFTYHDHLEDSVQGYFTVSN